MNPAGRSFRQAPDHAAQPAFILPEAACMAVVCMVDRKQRSIPVILALCNDQFLEFTARRPVGFAAAAAS
jgi:hypothetical protein